VEGGEEGCPAYYLLSTLALNGKEQLFLFICDNSVIWDH